MKPKDCPRIFEVEAMRDGRLGDAERASFERHLATCAPCARERRALDALGDVLRASREGEALDELHARRERTRLLAAFDRALIAPERPSRARVIALAFAAILLLFTGFLFVLHARSVSPSAPSAAAVVHAQGAARWSSRAANEREEILLEQGTLWIRVEHASSTRRVVVVLPDGELEDTGTTFTVSVAGGCTTRVAVDEGSVVVRLHGAPPVTVRAGGAWAREEPAREDPAPASAAPSASAAPPASSAPPAVFAVPAEPNSAAKNALSNAPPRGAPSHPAAADPAADFRLATSALDAGDNARAAAAFAAFLAANPRDPRAEDAAYLRVIALQRGGDDGAMKSAAREYLERFPAGFRRAEVEALAR